MQRYRQNLNNHSTTLPSVKPLVMTSVKRPPKQIRPLVPGMNIDYIYKVKICRSTLGAPIESTCLQPN